MNLSLNPEFLMHFRAKTKNWLCFFPLELTKTYSPRQSWSLTLKTKSCIVYFGSEDFGLVDFGMAHLAMVYFSMLDFAMVYYFPLEGNMDFGTVDCGKVAFDEFFHLSVLYFLWKYVFARYFIWNILLDNPHNFQ